MTTQWVARFNDEEDRSEEDIKRIVRDLLAQAGLRVHNVNRPLQLNPQPLRVRKDT